MANTKVTQHVIANNAITADQIASAAVTDAKLHSTLDLSGKTLTLPATAIPSASTATTQAASDNTTKLATTAYVTTAIGNLVDSAPTALDTLNELAAALGDDANFSGTVTTSLAGKLPLAGGTMTGDIVLSGAPTSGLHPATKTYTDTADALKLNLSGGTLTGDLILNTTTALQIPVGTTGQRPTAATGQIRWNSTDGAIEVYNGTAWTAVGTGSSNKVLDTFTGDGSNATFTLSVTPANEDAIMVFIDGAYQEKSDYVLTNNSLVLDTAPLLNEKIAVHITTASVHDGTTAVNQQFTATSGQTDFTLSQDPKSENNTQVYINGVYQQKTDYTVTGTTLAFDTGLTVGDVVEVNMFTVATLGNTDTVNEGVSNLYHTTARARGAISVSGNAISYNSSTGVITSAYEESPTFTGNVNITGDLNVGAADGNNAVMNLSANTGNWVFTNVQSSRNLEISDSDGTGTVLTIDTSGRVGIGTTSPTQKLDVAGTALVENAKLKAIAESNTDTALDVFVYDTRKDSDGGAWRKRTQHTSWYNETLNTSTRGARKEFPCVAVIVAESTEVTIYDGDDPDMPMWMVFPHTGSVSWATGGTSTLNAITALNSIVMISSGVNSGGGIGLYNFAKDDISISYNSTLYSLEDRKISTGRLAKSYLQVTSSGGYPLINSAINDIAMTVLPNAPIDSATGLPVPTIAVATNGGVSIIKDDGAVVDITNGQDSSAFNYIDNLFFRKDGALVWVGDSASNVAAERFLQVLHNLPTKDTNQGSVEGSSVIDEQYGPSHKNGSKLKWATTAGVSATSDAGENFAVGTSGALHLLKYNRAVEQEGAIAHITSDYNTGYMLGDIKLATLSDTSTTNVTGGTQPDRSYNNNALTVNGTITKTAVATGADLVAYNASNTSSYLEQAYNSNLNFGTAGDFHYSFWVYSDSSATYNGATYIFERTSVGDPSSRRIEARLNTSTNLQVYATSGVFVTGSTAITISSNSWSKVDIIRSNNIGSVWVNGVQKVSGSHFGNMTDTSATLTVCNRGYFSPHNQGFPTGISLFRVSATAPTAEQIAKIYNDEKFLFQENAKATLYGSSDAVTALAYDDDTELLHVGTSAGRSEFQGLRRVNNTTDAVGAAISASNGFIVEE